MKQIVAKIAAGLSKSSLLHGLMMAVGVSVLKVVYPVVTAILDNTAYVMPTWQSLVKVAIAAGTVYLFKNIFAGSSAPAITDANTSK